ncbi:MAG: phosphatase PAP2 family protein [Candidatus Saccharimonas sp.]
MQFLISVLADWMLLPISAIAAYMLLWRVKGRNRYDIYAHIFMAGISSYLFAKIVAQLWQPTGLRPFEILGTQAGASYLNNPGFPSDHALFATFLTLAVWYATRSKLATGIMILLTVGLCAGRVLALVHTPLDIVGGIVVALLGGIWYIASAKKLVSR